MLTRILTLCLLLLALAPRAGASDERAIDAYRRGDTATARTEWLAVLDDAAHPPSGAERARILYDLGNVAFREGKTLEAVGWYTAALRLRPRDADTRANLEEARSRAKLEPAFRGDLSSSLRRIVGSFTAAEARWFALAGLLVFGAALVFEALRGGWLGQWVAVCGAVFACMSFVPCIGHSLREGPRSMLVIAPDSSALKSEPRDKAATINELQAGAIVEYVDDLPEWTKVRVTGGFEGWVPKSAVFMLER